MRELIKFDTGEKVYELDFKIRDVITLEKKTGKPMHELEDSFSLGFMAEVLHIAIQRIEKDITLDGVMDLMDDAIDNHGFEYVGDVFGKLMEQATKKKKAIS